jgi:hypothetical protein
MQATPALPAAPACSSPSAHVLSALPRPDVCFGALTDVQYADCADGTNFTGTARRYFRSALTRMEQALHQLAGKPGNHPLSANPGSSLHGLADSDTAGPVDFVVQLGDLLDGRGKEQALETLRSRLLPAFRRAGFAAVGSEEDEQAAPQPPPSPQVGTSPAALPALPRASFLDVHHLIGNHELYCFRKSELQRLLGTGRAFMQAANAEELPVESPGATVSSPTASASATAPSIISLPPNTRHYYSFSTHPSWRFLVLDAYDVCAIDQDDKDGSARALDFLRSHNRNIAPPSPETKTAPAVDWLANLPVRSQRYVPYNGALSSGQLHWLRAELLSARRAQQRCVIFSHVALHPGAGKHDCLVWNWDEVAAILHAAPAGVVAACLYGHDHAGGYGRDKRGIHHLTLPGVLECEREGNAFGRFRCYSDRIEVEGYGALLSAVWKLPRYPSAIGPVVVIEDDQAETAGHEDSNVRGGRRRTRVPPAAAATAARPARERRQRLG